MIQAKSVQDVMREHHEAEDKDILLNDIGVTQVREYST